MILNIDPSLLHPDLKHQKCDVQIHVVILTKVARMISKFAQLTVKETNVAKTSRLATIVTFTR